MHIRFHVPIRVAWNFNGGKANQDLRDATVINKKIYHWGCNHLGEMCLKSQSF